ncbi:uncharacterized protein UHO2_00258 [Ustilago hordei]|uniref:uncharacterized protein n=1 Tax=Ustilago hordei TaxID=120017 RepID=UPI001A598383|nr:uncharacterized protein UHO2_00258 [Ustilago hordei]SYW81754.1 uncharacterized protein UHO2_00258 [Ustilago hordei]
MARLTLGRPATAMSEGTSVTRIASAASQAKQRLRRVAIVNCLSVEGCARSEQEQAFPAVFSEAVNSSRNTVNEWKHSASTSPRQNWVGATKRR